MRFGKATRFARAALWGLRVAALAFAGAISWPVLLGVAAIAIVIAKWKQLKAFFTGFWDGLKQDIDKSGLGDAFSAIVKWTEPARKAVGKLWSSIKKLFSFGDDTKKKIGRSIYNKTLGRLFRGLELLKKAAKGIEGIFKSASEYASQFFDKTGQTISLLDRYNKLNYEQKRQLGMDIGNTPSGPPNARQLFPLKAKRTRHNRLFWSQYPDATAKTRRAYQSPGQRHHHRQRRHRSSSRRPPDQKAAQQ